MKWLEDFKRCSKNSYETPNIGKNSKYKLNSKLHTINYSHRCDVPFYPQTAKTSQSAIEHHFLESQLFLAPREFVNHLIGSKPKQNSFLFRVKMEHISRPYRQRHLVLIVNDTQLKSSVIVVGATNRMLAIFWKQRPFWRLA